MIYEQVVQIQKRVESITNLLYHLNYRRLQQKMSILIANDDF